MFSFSTRHGFFFFFFFFFLSDLDCLLRVKEKHNVLTWAKTEEKQNMYLKWGKIAKKKKKKRKTKKECTTKNE